MDARPRSVVSQEGKPQSYRDDFESLVYTLLYLTTGRLPWQDQPSALKAATKREMLTSSGHAAALTNDVDCPFAAAALQALYGEVRRYQRERRVTRTAGMDFYDSCMAALAQQT